MHPAGLNAAKLTDASAFTTPPSMALPKPANDPAPAVTRRKAAAGLPARVAVTAADGTELSVTISGACVAFRVVEDRTLRAVEPLETYRGVAVVVSRGAGEAVFALELCHDEAALTVPLGESHDAATIAREWQAWAKALGLPLIAVEADGSVHAELTALGVVLAERPSDRRAGSALVGRRSRRNPRRHQLPLRALLADRPVIVEREIIART